MGVPVLTMELAVGRASRKSAVLGYKTLEKAGSKWHIHGWICMLGCYLLMTFASFSTIIAVFENIVAFCEETFGLSRKRSAIVNCIAVLVLSLPCVLGFNAWSSLRIGSRNVLNIEDYIVSNLMLPLGSLVFLLFCVTKWGWGFDRYYEECNSGKGLRFPRILKPFFQFALPVLIIIILVQCII